MVMMVIMFTSEDQANIPVSIDRRDAGHTDALCRRSAAVRTEFARLAFSVAAPTGYYCCLPTLDCAIQ